MDAHSRRLVHYDAMKRRLWIAGQRCHHGATGALVAGAAGVAFAVQLAALRSCLPLVATGGILMAHDWHDRKLWFMRGWQNQP